MATTHIAPVRIEAVRRFNRFYRTRIGVLDQDLLASRFSLTEARVLLELVQQSSATASDLAEALSIDAGYLSRILGSFESDGLIERRQSPDDRRQWLVTVTVEGRRALATLDERSGEQIGALLGALPEEDQDRLVSAMHTIEDVLGGAAAGVPEAFVLRPPRPGDLGMITHRHGVLYADEFGYDETFEAIVAEILVRFVREHDPKRERLWVAERDGVFAGSIMCVAASPSVGQLRLLLVEPKMRGHGLGRHLVDACLRFARRAGYESMTLWNQSGQEAARRLYERAGFCLRREEPHQAWGRELTSQWWERAL